jgi:hypothetical protein
LNAFEALCAIAIATGLILRFYRLGAPFWLDEAVTANISSGSLAGIPGVLARSAESNPPLIYLLAHAWARIFGGSDAAFHALTACIGSLGVFAVLWAGFRAFGRSAGLAAAALLALHPFHLAYSQELRSYGLLVLLSTLSFGFLIAALEGGRRRDWCAFALVSLANLYTHNYAFFLLAGQAGAAAAALRGARPKTRRLALGAFMATFLGYLPWLGILRKQAAALASITPFPKTSMAVLAKTAAGLSGASLSVGVAFVRLPWAPAAVVGACSLGVLLWPFAAPRRSADPPSVLLLASIAACLAIPLAVSLSFAIYLPSRHSIIALPFLCLLMGAGLQEVRPASVRAACLLIFLGAYAVMIHGYFSQPKSFDRDIAVYLESQQRPGAVVASASELWRMHAVERYFPGALRSRTAFAAAAGRAPRVLLVDFEGSGAEGRQALLAARYRPLKKKDFGRYAEVDVFIP